MCSQLYQYKGFILSGYIEQQQQNSSHAVESLGAERRVSPPPRRSGASSFLESFDREVTV
jgi:hypothetical protein